MEGWKLRSDCGVCRGDIEGSACKQIEEVYDDSPSLAGEQLCVLSLANTLERNRQDEKTATLPHAWGCLEAALATQEGNYDSYSEQMLDEAFSTLDQIISDESSKPIATMEAISLKNFEAMFRARALGVKVTNEVLDETKDNIAALICTIDEISDAPAKYDGYVSGFMAEQIVTWLALNGHCQDKSDQTLTRYTLYPTSDREGKSENKRFNHDRYLLSDSGKVPIEIKRRHNNGNSRQKHKYDKSITMVYLEDILTQTAAKHGKSRASRRDNFLIDLIRCDLSGRESPKKQKILATASSILGQQLEKAKAS